MSLPVNLFIILNLNKFFFQQFLLPYNCKLKIKIKHVEDVPLLFLPLLFPSCIIAGDNLVS